MIRNAAKKARACQEQDVTAGSQAAVGKTAAPAQPERTQNADQSGLSEEGRVPSNRSPATLSPILPHTMLPLCPFDALRLPCSQP